MRSSDLKSFIRNTLIVVGHFVLLAFAAAAVGQDAAQEDAEEQTINAAVAKVAPSVVRIETLGGREKVEEVLVSEGPTTGVVVGEEGWIVSSSFNFLNEPASILVTTPQGKRAAAKIVARDRARMLTLLKIHADEKLALPEIAPRGELQVGQYAIAVGRTLDAKTPNLSVGVLSALQRAYGRAVQTDAKVSPANYGGPLVDIRGRVIGVLTPLPVMGEGETAGAQFYDSGIGFAAPLEDWLPRLATLKAGTDLQAGLMGVSLKPGDVYALPAEIAVCQINSPAYKAGLRAGDRLTEVDGAKITRQVQMRHALGRHYAGDKVTFVASRGDELVKGEVELVAKLEPYEYPMLGILPGRLSSDSGVVVRYVFPNSAAKSANLEPGDVILEVAGKKPTDAVALQQLIAAWDPAEVIKLKVKHGEELRDVEVKLTPLTGDLPPEPQTPDKIDNFTDKVPPEDLGLLELKLPEEKQECFAFVPKSYQPKLPHALVIWFTPPGQFEKAEVEKHWAELAEKWHLIVIAPRPGEAGKWNPAEVAVVRKFADNVISRYNVDRSRVVAHGRHVGGSMAWLTALAHRNLIRGVLPVDAPLPGRVSVENDPVNRLYVYNAASKATPAAKLIDAGVQRLKASKVPLISKPLEGDRDLNAAELEELAHWIDALGRI